MHRNTGLLFQLFAVCICYGLFTPLSCSISLAGRGNPLDSILWSLKERTLNGPHFHQKSTIDHFRSFSCVGRENRLYPELTSRCRTYYRCLGGVTYSYKCPEGKAINVESQECLPEDDVECPTVPPTTYKCWHQPDGFYPSYEDGCSSYYSCFNNSVDYEGKCDGNAIWDSATGSCGFGKNVVCNPPSCLGLQEGFYPLQGSSCTAYFSCSDGYRTDMLCPYGSIFDYMKKQCVSGPDAVCYERACEGRVNGLHAEPHAPCNTYYRCFNGAMVELEECPTGQIFNGRKCVEKSNFSCRREGEGSCGNKPDGDYASEDIDCRGFFYCKNRQMIRSFRCNQGLVFNGRKCVYAQNFICTPKPEIPDCTQKFDGYYTVEKSNCKMFFRCRDSDKISEHTCPGNQIFNGHHCVSPLFHTCSSKETGTERSLPQKGIYQVKQIQSFNSQNDNF